MHGSELRVQPGDAECAGLQDQPQSGTRCGAGLPKPQFLHQINGVTGNTTSQAVAQEQEVGSEPVSFWERNPGGTSSSRGRVPWRVKVDLGAMVSGTLEVLRFRM